MPVVGTAGHVDHGKSTLIHHITGRHPDRLAEERRRGLTIDLGFAWATLPGGHEVSFVDVPGHEKFLKNMLAGIEAIDVALFVVAADEGWMPQSEEHLAVLDLLEVDRGVVAVTKADAVAPDLLELALAEVSDRLVGSSLEKAPIIAVSGVTGEGVPELLDHLERVLPPESEEGARPRLWVDRSFSVAGAGTVVTGTLLDAAMSVDDQVEVYPLGLTGRVRSIQSHERDHDRVDPGRRVALNLAGIESRQLGRGDMVGLPHQWETSPRFAVSIRAARFVADLDRRGDYQLHIGSAAHRVEMTGLDDDVAVLVTESAIPITVGDRFILRDTGRKLVVAGGRVLDPKPPRLQRALRQARFIDPSAHRDEIAQTLLQARRQERLDILAAHSSGGVPADAMVVGAVAFTQDRLNELTDRAIALVDDEHRNHPLRPGLPIATLTARLAVDAEVTERLVTDSEVLIRTGPYVALTTHGAGLTPEQEEAWEKARGRLARGLDVPTQDELALDPEVLAFRLREGQLVRISPDLVYLPEQIEEIEEVIRRLDPEFTVAGFRDAAGLSRKYAVPILEWTDREGLTIRRGDLRGLR